MNLHTSQIRTNPLHSRKYPPGDTLESYLDLERRTESVSRKRKTTEVLYLVKYTCPSTCTSRSCCTGSKMPHIYDNLLRFHHW